MNKCWICGSDCYEDLTCTKCGDAMPWGPTPAELLVEAQSQYEDEEEDFEGDDAYARDVCVPRRGPI